jgi:hypothetical protein
MRRRVICKGRKDLHQGCGSDCYEMTWDFDTDDYDENPIWICNNCGNETPRTTRKRQVAKMTKTQQNMIKVIKSKIEHDEYYQWEDFKTELTGYGSVIVSGKIVRIGSTSDYDLFNCSIQIFLGRKGKVEGKVYAGLFGTDRELKSSKDLWMVYG